MSETTKKRLEIEFQTFEENIRIRLESFFLLDLIRNSIKVCFKWTFFSFAELYMLNAYYSSYGTCRYVRITLGNRQLISFLLKLMPFLVYFNHTWLNKKVCNASDISSSKIEEINFILLPVIIVLDCSFEEID